MTDPKPADRELLSRGVTTVDGIEYFSSDVSERETLLRDAKRATNPFNHSDR